jgi:DNA repair exonuclease SbcCD nuclease subunit
MKNPYWIVLADTQLGAIHWQNPQREEDYYNAFQNQCQKAANDPNCLGILGLGDLRERASIQAKNLGGLNRGLEILHKHNKPLLALMGNHDYTIPNWIEEMCYPSLKDLTNPEIQRNYGFNPNTTLALHYTPKSQLLDTIANNNPEQLNLLLLHQSLKELTTNLRQSYDLSLEDLQNLGVGKTQPCLILLGDLHNYGDAQLGNLTAVYPGSLEMTDINEGANGLKSNRLETSPHDYRKFVLHLIPHTLNWSPVEIQPRPWIRTKAKTEKEAQATLNTLKLHLSSWERPGCVLATCPKSQIQLFRKTLEAFPTLECRIEEYQPDIEESPLHDQETNALSWSDNKKALEELGEKTLDLESFALLQALLQCDGSTHNPKNDVLAAWENWTKTSPSSTPKNPPTKTNNPEKEAPLPNHQKSNPSHLSQIEENQIEENQIEENQIEETNPPKIHTKTKNRLRNPQKKPEPCSK